MKAIIHAGLPKTGSTTIQTWIHTNRNPLRAKDVHSTAEPPADALIFASIYVALHELGLDEMSAWQRATKRRRNMAGSINEIYNSLTSELEKLSNEPGVFIYSCEGIYKSTESQIISLDLFLSKFFQDRTYVVYIRDIVDFFVSMYSQKLKNCCAEYGEMKFSELLFRCSTQPQPFGIESSLEHLFVWNKVLGEKFQIRLLEPDWLFNGNLIADFSSLIGVDEFCKPNVANESFAAEYIEYVRFMNRKFSKILPLNIRREVHKILSGASFGKPKLSASDAHAESIYLFHFELLERIRETFFPDKPFLFSPKFRGDGIMPVPLTNCKRVEIESLIQSQLAPMIWNSYKVISG